MFDLSASFHWEEMPATNERCTECKDMIIGSGMIYVVQIGSGLDMEVMPAKDTLLCMPCYNLSIEKQCRAE